MSARGPWSRGGAWSLVGAHTLLVVHAIRRHKLLFALTWLGVVALSLGLVAGLSKTYDVQTTIQVSPTQVISASGAGAPSGPGATGSGTPGKYAFETVLSHQNLVSLIRQAGLVEQWPKTRAPLPRLKDAIWSRLFPPPSPEDRVAGFVGLLEKSLWVSSEQTTVTIGIHFPDPQLALRLVEAAQQNFLESRQVAEISTIGEAIAILENRAAQAREALEASVRKVQEARKERASKLGRRPPPLLAPTLALPRPRDKEGSDLELQVESRQRAIAALQESRQRRISDLESKLEEKRAQYSETHPTVVDLRETLEALREESPQIAALKEELAPLEAELKQRGLLPDVPLKVKRARLAALDTMALTSLDPQEDRDPEIDFAKTELRHAFARYNGLLDRIEAAQLELEGARAAFKYRYLVIQPAQRPRGPVSPKAFLVAIASLVAGLFLAAFGPTFVDLTSRTFVEDWQVEQALGVPLLGTLPDRRTS